MSWLLVGLGAAVGSACRQLLFSAVGRGRRFPAGLLAVNLLGCLLAGAVAGAAPGPRSTDLLAVGLLGGFTTASALAADVLQLAAEGDRRAAALDLVLTLGPGLALAAAGLALGRALA